MSLVICNNCGAEYDSTKHNRICPYCGMEETEKAIQDTKEDIDRINEATEKYKSLPERIAKIMSKKAAIAVMFLAVIGVLFVVNTRELKQAENLEAVQQLDTLEEELEQAYQEKDVNRIDELYWDHFEEMIQRRYDKYTDYMFNAQGFEVMLEEEKTILSYDLSSDIAYTDEEREEMRKFINGYLFGASVILNTCYEAEKNNYNHGGRKEYEYYRNEVTARLQEKWKFTETQVDEIRAVCTNQANMTTMREELYPYVDIMWENMTNEM